MFEANTKGQKKGFQPEPAEVLFQTTKGLLKDWGYSPVFVDFWHVDGKIPSLISKKRPLEYMAGEARAMRLNLIPVTALGRQDEYQQAVSQVAAFDTLGACVRITPEDVLKQDVGERLTSLIRRLGLSTSQIDLLLDYQVFDPDKPAPQDLLKLVPHLGKL
jgi:hypothetical protein